MIQHKLLLTKFVVVSQLMNRPRQTLAPCAYAEGNALYESCVEGLGDG